MTAPAVPLAVFCAVECDISGALCQRIQCDGLHNPHGQDAWRSTDTKDDMTDDLWEVAAPDGSFARFADERDAREVAEYEGGTVSRGPREVLDELDRVRSAAAIGELK